MAILHKRFEFPSGVAFQTMGEDQDGVMMSLATGYLYRCNRTASVVLSALAEGKSVDEAAQELTKRFNAPAEQARGDAAELVADLEGRRLLRAVA